MVGRREGEAIAAGLSGFLQGFATSLNRRLTLEQQNQWRERQLREQRDYDRQRRAPAERRAAESHAMLQQLRQQQLAKAQAPHPLAAHPILRAAGDLGFKDAGARTQEYARGFGGDLSAAIAAGHDQRAGIQSVLDELAKKMPEAAAGATPGGAPSTSFDSVMGGDGGTGRPARTWLTPGEKRTHHESELGRLDEMLSILALAQTFGGGGAGAASTPGAPAPPAGGDPFGLEGSGSEWDALSSVPGIAEGDDRAEAAVAGEVASAAEMAAGGAAYDSEHAKSFVDLWVRAMSGGDWGELAVVADQLRPYTGMEVPGALKGILRGEFPHSTGFPGLPGSNPTSPDIGPPTPPIPEPEMQGPPTADQAGYEKPATPTYLGQIGQGAIEAGVQQDFEQLLRDAPFNHLRNIKGPTRRDIIRDLRIPETEAERAYREANQPPSYLQDLMTDQFLFNELAKDADKMSAEAGSNFQGPPAPPEQPSHIPLFPTIPNVASGGKPIEVTSGEAQGPTEKYGGLVPLQELFDGAQGGEWSEWLPPEVDQKLEENGITVQMVFAADLARGSDPEADAILRDYADRAGTTVAKLVKAAHNQLTHGGQRR